MMLMEMETHLRDANRLLCAAIALVEKSGLLTDDDAAAGSMIYEVASKAQDELRSAIEVLYADRAEAS